MPTCKDCIHYDICIFHLKGNENENCVHFKNTADVVPRSEYDHLKFEFDELDRECDRLEEVEARQDDTIVQAKQEVAREIFEEIENLMLYCACDYGHLHHKIQELKKKYKKGG